MKQRTYIRWEREHPNSLWQTDINIYKRKYMMAYLDDHSRFCTGIGVYGNATTKNALDLLDGAIESYNKPMQILTDHGVQYYAMRGGRSAFTTHREELGIQHILSGIGRPTTQGKIERFWQTMKNLMVRIPDIVEAAYYYNYTKPHTSLKYKTPAQAYFK